MARPPEGPAVFSESESFVCFEGFFRERFFPASHTILFFKSGCFKQIGVLPSLF